VHEVSAESYAVEYMDEYGMTVLIETDSSRALTAPSMTRMTSLTEIWLVYFITNLGFALSLNSHPQIEIECFGRFSA